MSHRLFLHLQGISPTDEVDAIRQFIELIIAGSMPLRACAQSPPLYETGERRRFLQQAGRRCHYEAFRRDCRYCRTAGRSAAAMYFSSLAGDMSARRRNNTMGPRHRDGRPGREFRLAPLSPAWSPILAFHYCRLMPFQISSWLQRAPAGFLSTTFQAARRRRGECAYGGNSRLPFSTSPPLLSPLGSHINHAYDLCAQCPRTRDEPGFLDARMSHSVDYSAMMLSLFATSRLSRLDDFAFVSTTMTQRLSRLTMM